MLTFRNPGLMDLTAATTFGVSVKENENPIGFFGTGFKYAVAIVLRLGGRVTLWRGLDKYEFTAKPQEVRGEQFNVVHMNDKPLGFTTRMGITWGQWQAFRELYCNALDEGGTVEQGTGEPEEGTTTIHVSKLDDVYFQRNDIVLPKQLHITHENDELRLHPGPSKHVYYRGVRVLELPKPSLYKYNILAKMDLTEDRTVANSYTMQRVMAEAIVKMTQKDVITRIVSANKEHFEHDMDFNWASIEPSQEFLDVVGIIRRDPATPLNVSALRVYANRRPVEHANVASIKLNEIEAEQLERALKFLSAIGHDVDASSVRIVDSLGEGVYGRALIADGLILISKRTFEVGTKYVAGTIMEEHLHITRKFADCTREFQNYLIDQVVTIGERFIGKPL